MARRRIRDHVAVAFDVIPAIDLAGGRVVRLVQGRFEAETTFSDDPLETARRFYREGARALHVIDLDAARTGERPPGHAELIGQIAASKPRGALLQVGGGFRSADAVSAALALGVDRVLVGTLAFREPETLRALAARHGASICVTADVLEGSVRVAGWLEDSGIPVAEAIRDAASAGVSTFLVTAIERDGTLAGPDVRMLGTARAAAPEAILLASGGIASVADVQACRTAGANGAVVGRALYAGAFTLGEALEATA
jgi:phosphoribosylformimino-5-aminoimidazole carboxamide ribotide isomerase